MLCLSSFRPLRVACRAASGGLVQWNQWNRWNRRAGAFGLVFGLGLCCWGVLFPPPAAASAGASSPVVQSGLGGLGGLGDALVALLERLGTLGEQLRVLLDLLGDARRLASLVGDLLGWLLVALAGWLREQLVRLISDPLANILTRTPPVLSYDSPTVRHHWETMRAIANGALALVALVAGLNLIVRQQVGLLYHDAAELLPRLALGALMANTSLWWAQVAIDANNALCAAIGTAGLPGWDNATWLDAGIAVVVAGLVYLVMGLVLLLQQLMRLALLDVLLVVSPLGLLCWVLPQTQRWSSLWAGLFVRTVFVQFLQATALALGSALMVELTGGSTTRLVYSFLIGIAVVLLTMKLPGLLQGGYGDGLAIARYYAYRQGAQAIQAAIGRAGRLLPAPAGQVLQFAPPTGRGR